MAPRTPEDLKNDIQRAVTILELFTDPNKGRDVKMLIPPSVLREAHGIVFIRLYKVGFMVSAKSGTGVIIARLPDGSWSAPSGVSISSLGFGHQAGGQVIDSIIVMNYRAAVKAFYDGGGQLQLGVGASLAAGPFGRAADVAASASSTTHIAATYAYSASKGLYAGYSFEGSRISERPNTNRAYYGRSIPAKDILTGAVAPPQDAAKLYQLLTEMGAGPRPGLPFAPQKTQNMPSHMASPMPYEQQPPPRPQNNNNGGNFEEPPPPYEQFDKSKEQEQQRSTAQEEPITESVVGESSSPVSNHSNASIPVPNAAMPETSTSNEQVISPIVNESSVSLNQEPPSINASSKPMETSDKPNEYMPPAASSSNNNNFDAAYNIPLDQHGYPQHIKKPLDDSTPPMTIVVAKYDYTADRPTDLSFKAGDTIVVTKRLDDRQTWWEGEIGDKRGFFPANYTEEITE